MGRPFNIVTLNARTLAPKEKLLEIELALSKIKWDIVAVQEARIVGLASFKLAASGIVVFHSGGATARNGVAFLLQPALAKGAVFRGLSDRLATLLLPQHKLYLVNAYAPTSTYDDAVYDDFLDQVEAALQSTPMGFMPILVGDFNCRVAKEPGNERFVGEFASPTPNSRGRSFTETCVRNKLRIQNTFPKRRRGRIWTWRSPNGTTFNQIDFVASPITARVVNCGVVGNFHFNSDHRLVRLALSLPNKVRHKRCRERLVFDKVAFTANASLLASMPLARPTSATDAFYKIQAFAKTAATNCWKKKQSPPWISPATQNLLAQRHLLRSIPQSNVAFSISCKMARTSIITDIKRRKESQAIEAVRKGRSIVKAMLNLHSYRKRLQVPDPVTGALSQVATKTAVQSFFGSIYQPAVQLPLAIPSQSIDSLPPFLPDETYDALSHLKCGHSAGSDGVLPDMLYHSRAHLAPFLSDLLNHLVSGDQVPEDMVQAVVSLLHKKGDPSLINNFRPISLLTVTLKTCTRVILKRIERTLGETESPTQTGFRRGHSTLDNLHTVKQIVERTHEFGIPLYLGFVDFRKAFDCVEWSAVWQALWTFGVHPTLIHLLRRLYESSTTRIRVNEEFVEVNVRRGVRQGDTLSPSLFNAVLRQAMNDIDWEQDGLRIDGRNLIHLEYADDVVLVAKTRPELERMLRKLMDSCARVGLEVNSGKTVLLTSCTTTRAPIIINNQVFNFADSATYLGGRITLPLDHLAEVEHRIRLGWFAWSKLSHLLSTRLLPMKTRRRLFESCVSSTVLYGSELWALRASEKERLSVTQRKMERKMLGISLRDRWRNENIRKATNLRDWNEEALRRKTKWARKLGRMGFDQWSRASTDWVPYNKTRPQGQPRARWKDDLRRSLGANWWHATAEE